MKNRKLVLANGKEFIGYSFGSQNEVVAELIFNTAVVGYQEILSDPTNCNKIVCMTYPLIGNYGLTDEDYESKHICTKGMIVREYNEVPSNFRYTRTLGEVMEENCVSGIYGVDTRSIMNILRKEGSMKAIICDIEKPLDECLEAINNYVETNPLDQVSSKKVWYARTPNPVYNVAVIDLGTKINFIKRLNNVGCNVISFPYDTSKEEILKYKPNGLFISNGPGNPNDFENISQLIKSFIGTLPIFGVCLGANLVAGAYGIASEKMKTGHHGCNYPVKNLETGRIEITSQNRQYKVLAEDVESTRLVVTHKNVIDGEVEGFKDARYKVMGALFEPTNPINADSEDLFKDFFAMMMKKGRGARNA